ncbi:hypothetical protein M1L60_16995 [Actinoplanes sp. TRM 88003]|uniref:ABC transporter permease n=1 Tax=Paractinoplanes aksuensis TaxID=2939490 RepID=A0ABT1DN83_9ACTN|nr:hypothetical protein [Actinoplanes aksuensis]MCO8272292.1 hypothetical protein [Actinoplanes aksuensis]
MRGPSARREFGFVLAVAVSGVALVLVVAFAPWYPAVGTAPAEVSPSLWQQVSALLGQAVENAAPLP